MTLLKSIFFLIFIISIGMNLLSAEDIYDVVIKGGKVMDPESGLNEIRNVGINNGKISAISEKALNGKKAIDAAGLVVAPGFIDMHEHGQEPQNYEFQAHDGVTTSLELELGTGDVAGWYAQREGKSLINFGVSAGHIPIRMKVLKDPGPFLPIGDAAHRVATSEELSQIKSAIEDGLKEGAVAVGMGINYTEGASREEIVEVFRVAASHKAPVHVHLRNAGILEPNNGIAGLEEVIAAAATTGAPLHVVHITSMGLKLTPQLIEMVKGVQARGLDVTTECYPYTAGSTGLESAMFDEGWQKKFGITYKDLQWAKTGERLTEETFARYRKEGGIVIIHMIPEEAARVAIADPIVMIASDGMPITGPKVHPRGQGTFSRVLGHYVREEKVLDLMTALKKMTLMPAQRLEKYAQTFQNKGRVRVGADADFTIFDADRVIDKATFDEPLQKSQGIQFVLVNGQIVIDNGQLVKGVYPGKAARVQ
ncbi:MAG TPA: amidohydrolase family protein [Acidobacteriota bacterium]|nr:amidohydrolase family protein [Acidobacteriota bacterium]